MRDCHGIVRRKAHSQGYTAALAVAAAHAMRPRKAGLKFGPSRALSGPREAPRGKFLLSRDCPEKVLKPVESAGAAICTNSVAEITCGVPPPRRDPLHSARRDVRKKETGRAHAWGTPGHCGRVQVLEKLEIVSYCVSRAGPSRSRLKAPKRPNPSYARAVEGTINPRER